jgi:hypothetical protein
MAGKIYNAVQWPASASGNTVADYDATGESTNHCLISSSSAGSPAHLTRAGAGTCSFSHCTIQDMHVATGTWDASDGTNVNTSGNEGWTWPAGGHPAIKRFGGVPFAAVNRGVW